MTLRQRDAQMVHIPLHDHRNFVCHLILYGTDCSSKSCAVNTLLNTVTQVHQAAMRASINKISQ
jgi:hypothetical protein